MPTVMRLRGFRFFFFSNEGQEPAHIHVQSGDAYAKLWLRPVAVAASIGFDGRELNSLRAIVRENVDFFEKEWNDFFSSS